MAGKKPAKPMASQSKQIVLDPAVYGQQIKYIGTKNSPTTCPSCGRQTIRGMVRQKGENFFCSLICASKN